MRDKSRDPVLYAVERRAVVSQPVVPGVSGLRVCWQPVGLFKACSLEEAIEKAAFECQIPSVLRATYIPENKERVAIDHAFKQGLLPHWT